LSRSYCERLRLYIARSLYPTTFLTSPPDILLAIQSIGRLRALPVVQPA